jgi:tripartite-type tricarboxylate transporter receptor subunit TctC
MALMSRLALAPVVVLALSFAAAHAQNYPNRPVRVIIPFGAGGVADVTTRLAAEKLGEKLGQRFVVENQPGAGGINAARSVTSAPSDGHTLGLATNGTAVSVALFKSLPFDPVKDFAAISMLGSFDLVLATGADSQFRTLQDFVKAAREQPGKLNVGTINVGSTQNLGAELFKTAAGVNFQIVPYRNSPEALIALLRNDVQLVMDFHAALKSNLADQKIRALATSGPSRSQSLPNVPTAQESGVRGYDVTSWNGLVAPSATPADVVAALNKAVREILADADLKKRYLDLGIEAKASSPDELKARLVADIEKWGKVIERAGIPKQ